MSESHEIKQARLEEILSSTQRDVKDTKLGVQHVAAAVNRLEQSSSNNALQEAYMREQIKEIDDRVVILEKSNNVAVGALWFFGVVMTAAMALVYWLFSTVNQTHELAITNKTTLENMPRYTQERHQ